MPKPRILLAWELGANRGHIAGLGAVARALDRMGAEIAFAAQRLDAARGLRPWPDGMQLLQAPVWPGLLATTGFSPSAQPSTFGDILAELGLRHSGVVEHLLIAWETLFRLVRPDAVVTNFAPMAQLAARGRIPVVATGTGFSLPPCETEAFRRLRSDLPPAYAEDALLTAVNHALHKQGRSPLERLPEMLAAEARLPGVFAAFDPYIEERREARVAPFLPSWSPTGELAGGNGIFAYSADVAPGRVVLHEALARLGNRVTYYSPNLPAQATARLIKAGVRIEPRPLGAAAIAARCGLVVSHGGLGLVSMTLAAGLPQVVLPYDLEKVLTAQAVERLGVGHALGPSADAAAITEAIMSAGENAAIRARARAIAPDLARELGQDSAEAAARAAMTLAGVILR